MRQETERETALVDTLRPRISTSHGNSDDDQADNDFRIRVKSFRPVVRVGWPRTRSSDQSERCTKETSTCDTIEKTLHKMWRPCKEHRKSIEEKKKVTPCNPCGAIGHLDEDCTQPARSRKKRSTSTKGKGKKSSVQEKNLMPRCEEVHPTTRLWRSAMMVR